MPLISARLHAARDAHRNGDLGAAWGLLLQLLRYPSGADLNDAQFAQALELLHVLGGAHLSSQTVAAASLAAADTHDVQALFGLGYLLSETGETEMAATILARANVAAPGVVTLVTAFARALERSGLYDDAYRVVHESYGVRQQDWHARHAYSFNALMSGRLIEARQNFALVGPPVDDETEALYEQMIGFFDRHRRIADVTPLDDADTRSWHYVITGGVLTHLAPSLDGAAVRGRYCTAIDSKELVHEGVIRALATLQAWDVRPDQLVYANNHPSETLARVLRQRLGIPIEPFSSQHIKTAGLFVAYDLGATSVEFATAMATHRPGQLLFSHAGCWAENAPFTSDITSYHYETNVERWSSDTTTSDEQVAEEISASVLADGALADLEQLVALAETIGPPPLDGVRKRFYPGAADPTAE